MRYAARGPGVAIMPLAAACRRAMLEVMTPPRPFRRSVLLFCLVLASNGAAAQGVDLPEEAPIPEPRRESPAPPSPIPVPSARPPAPASGAPARAGETDGGLPAAERACRARLRALDVDYEASDPVDEKGCTLDHPVSVTSLAEDVALEPAGVLTCETAETAARLVQNVAAPDAKARFGTRLSGVRNASAYVCRSRAGGGKPSEHASGRALDISAFTLADGRNIAVRKYSRPRRDRAAFLNALRKAACGPFTTVLGPGTNADHADHFHFDIAERSGGAYCR